MTRTFYRIYHGNIEKVVYKICDKVITKRFYEWRKRRNEWRLVEIGSNIPLDVLETKSFDNFSSFNVNVKAENNAYFYYTKEEWLKRKEKGLVMSEMRDILFNKIFKEE